MTGTWARIHTLLLVFALIGVIAFLASEARGGPLDPTGGPSPTGKTLEEIPGSWSRDLPANDGVPGPDPPAGCNSTRFQCVLAGNWAVLDRETGLVWTRFANLGPEFWSFAIAACHSLVPANGNVISAGVSGWRLPTVEEMMSLFDYAGGATMILPTGHPFSSVQPQHYWTATTWPLDANYGYHVDMVTGLPGVSLKASSGYYYLCVRGPGI